MEKSYLKSTLAKKTKEEGLEFKAAKRSNQCIDFLNKFRKSPDVSSVYCECLVQFYSVSSVGA